MSYPTPSDLWGMSPFDFNKWRREHDLKRLFELFQKKLPHFDEWLAKNNLTVEFILETDKPGHFFYWNTDVYCIKTITTSFAKYFFVPIEDDKHEKQIQESKEIEDKDGEKSEYYKFKPYLAWIKAIYKIERPISSYGTDLTTFRYVTGSAPDSPEKSQWSIAPGFTVLKLGGTKISGWLDLINRNLDFTNLDFLVIDGEDTWNRDIEVFYCHCANITTKNVAGNFTKFYNCEFLNFRAIDSRFYWVEFHDCEIYGAYFENSNIGNMVIKDCSANGFSFNRVEVDNIKYSPRKKEYFATTAENYKRFRILYQSNGLRYEASDAYFNERLFELKHAWKRFGFRVAFADLWKRDFEYGLSAIRHHLKKLPQIISDLISCLIWGFGERPIRILGTSFFVLIIYASIYYFSNNTKLNHDIVNSLYLSIVSFTTLGFGDITPESSLSKLIVGSEALIGAFCMGLIVAGFANKSRY